MGKKKTKAQLIRERRMKIKAKLKQK